MLYQRKPIQAIKFLDVSLIEIAIQDMLDGETIIIDYANPVDPTLKVGGQVAHVGDYIVKSANGTYVYDAKIFEAMYEPIKE